MIFTAALLVLAPQAIFVSPVGDDAGPGTSERPFRTIQHAADQAGPGATVTIGGGIYQEAIRLTRSGNYFNRAITIQAAPGEAVVIDGKDVQVRGPLFSTAGCDHLILRGLDVRNSNSEGLGVVGSYRVRVENCRTENTARSGIFVDKSNDVVVSHCDVTGGCARSGEESVSLKRSTNVIFEDSIVHDTGHEGIDVKEGSRHVLVRRNQVFKVERQGLYADAWDADTGDIRFENNTIHNCMVGLVACTETGGLLHDVAFVGNVVYDCRGPGMMVAKWGNQHMTHRIKRISYINNTVVNCGGGGAKHDWSGGMLMENDQAEDVTVLNNIFSGSPYAQFRVSLNLPPKRIVARGNLIDGLGENLTRGNRVGPARFVNPLTKDYHLAPGSPAIDAGVVAEGLPETDADGKPRVNGRRIDIGAYER